MHDPHDQFIQYTGEAQFQRKYWFIVIHVAGNGSFIIIIIIMSESDGNVL